MEPEAVPIITDREKRRSFSNDRALNPSISGTEQDSPCSTQRIHEFPSLHQKVTELSAESICAGIGIDKPMGTMFSNVANTPRSAPGKASVSSRRQTVPLKTSHVTSNCDLLPVSRTPASKSAGPTCRVSLPLPSRSSTAVTPYRPNNSLLHSMASPDVSVNAPRIDRIEFPLASSEDPLFPIHRTLSTPTQCSSPSPNCGDRSITKDKCTVQILDRACTRPNHTNTANGGSLSGSECSEHNPTTVVSSRSSSESHPHRFDTSSYQQRAEALEGLLEFSARLLQQERFDELGVLLKPFGPEKISPRETAIWIIKSFKETTV